MVVLVHPSVPVADITGLIAYAKANPGKINMASAGTGSAPHMAGELFNAIAGTNMVHVPYRGQSQALSDLLGGQVQILFAAAPGTTDYIRSGKLRALAVTSASQAEVREGPADGREFPARLRSEPVVWHCRAPANATRDHRAAGYGNPRIVRGYRDDGAVCSHQWRAASRLWRPRPFIGWMSTKLEKGRKSANHAGIKVE